MEIFHATLQKLTIMTILKFFSTFLFVLSISSCQKDEAPPENNPSDATKPTGTFTAQRMGVFQEQNGYNAAGTAQLGTDDANSQWLRLAPDFTASLSTGAVTVYLSKNQNLSLNSATSFLRVDLVKTPGEHFYKINPGVGSDFKFAILWCASASVQFGNAELK
ncbi:MAG: DM13 domain-containing protein [Saprospiraceae bacterium]|nr:DM13 domain-containing protein [Saprospiraceae bacterium]